MKTTTRRIIRADTITLFLIGFGYAFISTIRSPVLAGIDENLAIAMSIATKGTFADPFGTPTGPTAHTAPIFPIYLAAMIRAFGKSLSPALCCVAAVWHGIQLGMLPLLSSAVLGNREIGFTAGVLSAVVPCFFIWPQWDSALSGAALAAWCLIACSVDEKSVLKMALLGLLGGCLLLINPVLGMPMAFWALCVAQIRSWAKFGIAAALCSALIVCLPWTVRNYFALGAFVPLRDNFGLELQVSNNDYAAPIMLGNKVALDAFHPSLNPTEAERVKSQGEISYNRTKLREAITWISGHPSQFTSLTIRRMVYYWFPPITRLHYSGEIGTWVITLLSLPALILIVLRRLPYRYAIVGTLAFAPLPLYLIQMDLRYRTPMLWLSVLMAAYSIEAAFSMKRRSERHAVGESKAALQTDTVEASDSNNQSHC